MPRILPDSRGRILKILYHHTPVRRQNALVREGIFGNFLRSFGSAGVKPEVYVLATYANRREREFLASEANGWTNLVNSLRYIDIKIGSSERSLAPYAQDTCVILDSANPRFITSSLSMSKAPRATRGVEKLLAESGLRPWRPKTEFNLEGGHVYATSGMLFYSDSLDATFIRASRQYALFVEDLISWLLGQISSILVPGSIGLGLPCHVDLVLSALEREDALHVFCVDFRETLLSAPLLTREQSFLLGRRLAEWDRKMNKLTDRIAARSENAVFHKVPGVLDLGPPAYVHSSANLLFHSTRGKVYAFYLKFPHRVEEENGIQINDRLDEVLKEANVSPMPISGEDEITNLTHIWNSAGLRCLIKVLART